MTCMKKLTALLVSAALALSLLAGCGGSKALSQVIADLLSGMYNNVTVEVDPDLTAALKKAAAAGSTQEEVLAALVEELNLSGVRLTLRQLQEGRQGDRGVELVFQSGADPDAAARSAVNGWASAFGALPDDGSYAARVAMIEAEGGYYIAVDVEVLKAGTPNKDDSDDDKDDDNGEDGGDDTTAYTQDTDENGNITSVTIKAKNGLQQLVDDLAKEGQDLATALAAVDITLNCDVTLTGNWTPIGTEQTPYTGTFDGGDCTISGLSVSSSDDYAGLFGCIGESGGKKGTVQNLTLDSPTVSSSDDFGSAGAVAGCNEDGTIENCHVTGSGAITGYYFAGGIVGENDGSITGCKVTISGSISSDSSSRNGSAFAGGIAGYNHGGSITGCEVTVNGSITATRKAHTNFAYAGGIVGNNWGTIESGCTVTLSGSGSISATATATASAGGIVGRNYGTIAEGCGPATGTGTVKATSGNDTVTVPYTDESGTHNAKQEGNAYAGTTCGLINGAPK